MNSVSSLSVSSKYIYSCDNIALLLKKNNIISKIIENRTVEQEGKHYVINCGCLIHFYKNKPKDIHESVWPKLKNTFILNDGYFTTVDGYKGSINDYNNK